MHISEMWVLPALVGSETTRSSAWSTARAAAATCEGQRSISAFGRQISDAMQFTMLFAFKCAPRQERITGPIGSVVRASRSNARRRSGCMGIRRPPRFFAMTSRTWIVPDATLRVENHGPIEAGNLAGAQAGLNRQQDHRTVAGGERGV